MNTQFPVYCLKALTLQNVKMEYEFGECLMTFDGASATHFHPYTTKEMQHYWSSHSQHRFPQRIEYWLTIGPTDKGAIPDSLVTSVHFHDFTFNNRAELYVIRRGRFTYPTALVCPLTEISLADIDQDYGYTDRQAKQIKVVQYDD